MGRSGWAITMIRQLDKNEEAARFYERSLAHHPGGEFLKSRMWFKIQLGSIKKTKKNPNQQLERTFLSGADKNDTQLYRCFVEMHEGGARSPRRKRHAVWPTDRSG